MPPLVDEKIRVTSLCSEGQAWSNEGPIALPALISRRSIGGMHQSRLRVAMGREGTQGYKKAALATATYQ